MTEALHPIQIASRMTGLSAYVIRIWEQRYNAVEPARTESNRRLYSQSDLKRLELLRDLTQAGHSIGQIARLPTEKLQELTGGFTVPASNESGRGSDADSDQGSLDSCLTAVSGLDEAQLMAELRAGARRFGSHGVMLRIVSPLIEAVGERWRNGSLSPANEHFASNTVRRFLMTLAKPFGGQSRGPSIVVCTPVGQLHDIGVHLVCAVASNLGWRVTNLGASLPAADIAGAAEATGARAVALSIVYPGDDPGMAAELRTLRDHLRAGTAVVIGGRAARSYEGAAASIGAVIVESLGELGAVLDRLREPASNVQDALH